MQYTISSPDIIAGNIKLPASKSISNRALILNALSLSKYTVANLSDCDDTNVMVNAFQSNNKVIDVKAAGTSMRFLTAFLAGLPGEWTIKGTDRMHQRPIHILVDALTSLGAHIEYLENTGYPPLKIRGASLNGGEIGLSGGVSSQFISALLMIAPTMTNGLTIHLEGDVISIPYIQLTLGMMAQYGVRAQWDDNVIHVHYQEYKAIPYTVESDWSAASYWYQMLALSGGNAHLELEGLFEHSMQGDSKVSDLFLDLGVATQFTDRGVVLTKTDRITKKFFHNFINEPDLAQTFAVTCCMMGIPFLFTGLQSLKIKETDRIEALKTELRKLGYVLVDRENSILEWDGDTCLADHEPAIDTYEDHRMAMAFAPAALKFDKLKINEPKVVSKSYPHYWTDLESVGFTILQQ